ncbi:MAG TPA: ATP-dependent DNA helicase RecG [Methyloceanibacter sp.]|nr:ATP-dependent DNA helicase RecG [Methyloceanibacter sp.]
MKPSLLAPLFAPARSLKGVGPRIEGLLNKLVAPRHQSEHARVIDLLWHLPQGVIDRQLTPRIADARIGELATLQVTVTEHRPGGPRRGLRAPYRVLVEDSSGALELVYFNADPAYLKRLLPERSRRLISGKLECYDGWLQMPHPDHVVSAETSDSAQRLPLLEPIYPLTAGLTNTSLRKIIAHALSRLPALPEWIDASWAKQNAWPNFPGAVRRMHTPETAADLKASALGRTRLAYDELLANQLALAVIRQRLRRAAGRPLAAPGKLRQAILAKLPFELTGAQRRVLSEIDSDLASLDRMLRLLQGDVGSGKTVVALLAMATVVEAGAQAALMAPTELLARQHLRTVETFATPAGLRVALLTGREKGREREGILAALRDGHIDILIGTHALIQEPVEFRDLALVVIDEQHRFGVHQRLALQKKGTGRGAELLVMTATPIPRTLLLTSYGDMDVSRLDEKPPGRKPVTTSAMSSERQAEVVEGLARAIAAGARVYWVCPLVAESEMLDIAAAEERHAELKKRFGEKVGIVHGRLAGKEKDGVMAAFAAGHLSILVSTTVIEVGVDVPNASIMVIEHAERFGLAQLHQLRGRVGRRAAQSSCILLYRKPLSEAAQARLNVMRSTEDGFVIAEEDLKLRGGGEVLGTRQSGLPAFRVAQLPEDEALLQAARDEARLVLTQDPDLNGPRADALKLLLYLFERDDAIKLMRAG